MKEVHIGLAMLVLVGTLIQCTLLIQCRQAPIVAPEKRVYQELVESGCMKDTDAGLAAIKGEHDLPVHYPWLDCMWEGGSIADCNAPCGQAPP